MLRVVVHRVDVNAALNAFPNDAVDSPSPPCRGRGRSKKGCVLKPSV